MGLISRVSSRTYRFIKNQTIFKIFVNLETSNLYDQENSFSLDTFNGKCKGDNAGALKYGLDHLFNNSLPADVELRGSVAKAMISVMVLLKGSEITSFAEDKSMPELDILMILCYKGLEISTNLNTCKTLFAWHAALEAKAGVGSILRVI